MHSLERTSSSPDYTRALAHGLAALLRPGDVVLLEGELGAGKTEFVRGIAEGLAADTRIVSSPTFVVINTYPCTLAERPGTIIHADAYRLTHPDDLDTLGWDALFDDTGTPRGNAIALVEWPRKLAPVFSAERCARVRMDHTGRDQRQIRIDLPDAWRDRPAIDRLLSREPARCAVTARWVSPTSPTYPFADERARLADLYRWMSGSYTIARPATHADPPPETPTKTPTETTDPPDRTD